MTSTTSTEWPDQVTEKFFAGLASGCTVCNTDETKVAFRQALITTGFEQVTEALRNKETRTRVVGKALIDAGISRLRDHVTEDLLDDILAILAPAEFVWEGRTISLTDTLDGSNALPNGFTPPSWLAVGAKVRRARHLPKFSGGDPWSRSFAIGTEGEVEFVDTADNTARISMYWVPWVELEPVTGAAQPEQPVEAPDVDVAPLSIEDQLREEVAQLRRDKQHVIRLLGAFSEGINVEANDQADRQQYCSDYEDAGYVIWRAGAQAMTRYAESNGFTLSSLGVSTPEFAGREREGSVSGYAEVTVRVYLSGGFTAASGSDGDDESQDVFDQLEIEASDIIDAIRSGSWEEDSRDRESYELD